MLRVALAQTRVGTEVATNGAAIRAAMKRAKAAGADVVQFTEGALSGYGRKALRPFETWSARDWRDLDSETDRILDLARELGLWTVFGSVSRIPGAAHPHNCLLVADAGGRIHGRYDKRFCSHNELAGWYTPGFAPFVFEVRGLRFGCLICLDGRFPEVWEEYRELGVHCVLFSSFTAGRESERDAAQDAIFGITAQAQAASHVYWVSLVTPANPVQGTRTQFITPRGAVETSCRRHRSGLAIGTLDLGPDGPWQATERGRRWRAAAREGGIYRAKAASGSRARSDRSGRSSQT